MPQSLPKAESLNVPQALAQALALHRQGRLAEAERLYAAILAVRPDHVDALQMMGLVKLAAGQPAEALRLVSAAMRGAQAVAANPAQPWPDPQRPQAPPGGGRELRPGDQAEIQISPRRTTIAAPTLASLGRDEEALESCRKAIAIKPDYAEAHYNIGTSLRTLGRYDEALKSFDRALALQPNYFKAHNNRGAVLEALNRLPEALASYERALALNPGFAEARNNRGRVLCAARPLRRGAGELSSRLWRSIPTTRRPITIAAASSSISTATTRPRRISAKRWRSGRIMPRRGSRACIAELPILYADEAEIARRRAAYEQKLRALCDDVEAGRAAGDLVKALAAKQPFLLAYQGHNDRDLQKLYGAMVCRIMARQFPAAALPPPPAPGEPIRVGIVSSFFYLHSNWKIPIKGWIGQMDRSALQALRLSPRQPARRGNRCRRRDVRPLRASRARRRRLAARDPGRRAACADLSRSADGHHVRCSWPRSGSPPCSAIHGAIRKPAACRRSIISSAAI